MDRLLDDLGVSNYIGCSKRSCWLCWQILRGSRFITQGTHGTLYWSCAYRFAKSDSQARDRLFETFISVADDLEAQPEDFIEGSADISSTKWDMISQTTSWMNLMLGQLANSRVGTRAKLENIKIVHIAPGKNDVPRIEFNSYTDLPQGNAVEQAHRLRIATELTGDQYLVIGNQISEAMGKLDGLKWEYKLLFADIETKPGVDIYVYILHSRYDGTGDLLPKNEWCTRHQETCGTPDDFSLWRGTVYLYAQFRFHSTTTREVMDVEDWMADRFVSELTRWKEAKD